MLKKLFRPATGAGKRTKRMVALCMGLIASASISQTTHAQDMETQYEFHIEAKSLGDALDDFVEQTGLMVLFPRELADVEGMNPVIGSFSASDALDQLFSGTSFSGGLTKSGAIFIAQNETSREEEMASGNLEKGLLASVAAFVFGGANAQDVETVDDNAQSDEAQAEDVIIVTGTNIRGSQPVGSNLVTLDRIDIERSGLSTTAQIIQTLPQTLGAGPNEATSSIQGTGAGAADNIGFGSSVNLRGLGADKTLTLINGRRAAAGGASGSFVDISSIPLTAVERIEVLTDGASALYGSDAISGVVNIILRKDYDGAETQARFGTVTSGGQQEYQVGQVFGKSWEGGNALVAYEFFKQDFLLAEDRGFAADSDLTAFGGDDFSQIGFGNPGTILAGGTTFAIPGGQDGTSLDPGDLVAGTSNTQNTRVSTSLLPEQKRHSVFATINQEISDRIEIFAEGRYAIRDFTTLFSGNSVQVVVPDTNPFFVDPVGGLSSVSVQYNITQDFGGGVVTGDVESFNAAAGANVELWGDWAIDLYGSFSNEQTFQNNENQVNSVALASALADSNPLTAFNPFGDGSNTNPDTINNVRGFISTDVETEVLSFNAKADGSLFELPGGALKLAAGLEYREENFQSGGFDFRSTSSPTSRPESDFGRDVFAVFSELLIPIVGEDNRRPGVEEFQISAAVRYEGYSDFGSTTNPKIGASWSPFEGLKVRGTYGTSFRAPLLTELDPNELNIFAFPFSDPMSPTGFSNVMFLFGDNPDLQPEEGTTWTAGVDFDPPAIPGFNSNITYFNVELDGRIASLDVFTALQREDEFAAAITRNPDSAVAQAFLDNPVATDFGLGLSGADIDVILDARLNNFSQTSISGLDFSTSYNFDTSNLGSFGVGFSGSYIFEFEEAFTPTAPTIDTVDTVGRQVDFRGRGNVTWTRDNLTTAVYVNYTDGYTDDVSAPSRAVDSFTTLDLYLGYNTGEKPAESLLRNLSFSVSAINLFDEDPPFVNNPNGVGFDPANASPRGRFIAFELKKQW